MLFWWGITTVVAYIFQVRRLLTFPAYRVGDFSEVGANSRFSTKTEPLIECNVSWRLYADDTTA